MRSARALPLCGDGLPLQGAILLLLPLPRLQPRGEAAERRRARLGGRRVAFYGAAQPDGPAILQAKDPAELGGRREEAHEAAAVRVQPAQQAAVPCEVRGEPGGRHGGDRAHGILLRRDPRDGEPQRGCGMTSCLLIALALHEQVLGCACGVRTVCRSLVLIRESLNCQLCFLQCSRVE